MHARVAVASLKGAACLLALALAVAAQAAQTGEQQRAIVGRAQSLYLAATSDKPGTVAQLNDVLAQLDKLNGTTMDAALERKAVLLRLRVLQDKYSIIESPFRGDKGGRVYLLQARDMADRWLSDHAGDFEVLVQLQSIEAALGVKTRATIDRLLEIAPDKGWPHLISSLNYSTGGDLGKAMQELIAAVKVEQDAYSAAGYMEQGVSLAIDAKCDFGADLRKIVNDIPADLSKPGAGADKTGAHARRLVATFEKLRARYLATFNPRHCLTLSNQAPPPP